MSNIYQSYVVLTKKPVNPGQSYKTTNGWMACCALPSQSAEEAVKVTNGTMHFSKEDEDTKAVPGKFIWHRANVSGIRYFVNGEEFDVSYSNGIGALMHYSGKKSDVVLPNDISTVEAAVFAYNKTIKTVKFPKNLTAILDNAFEACDHLTQITLGPKVKIIGKGAFTGCTRLKVVNLSSSVEHIDDEAFKDCTSLEAIPLPRTLKFLGHNVFGGCKSLPSVTIYNDAFDDKIGLN